MKCSSWTPAALKQPHIRTLHPPCFTVSTIDNLKPSVPKRLILVSSIHSIDSQWRSYLSEWALTNFRWASLCRALGDASFEDKCRKTADNPDKASGGRLAFSRYRKIKTRYLMFALKSRSMQCQHCFCQSRAGKRHASHYTCSVSMHAMELMVIPKLL